MSSLCILKVCVSSFSRTFSHVLCTRAYRGLWELFKALEPQGRIAVRDIVMEPCRTRPRDGALFAINMLVNTESGGTFTFEEFAEDLQAAGFVNPRLATGGETMNSVVMADKPRNKKAT